MKLVRLASLLTLTAVAAHATTQLNFALKLDKELLAQESVVVALDKAASIKVEEGLTVTFGLIEETEESAKLQLDIIKNDEVVCSPEVVVEYGKETTVTCQGPVNYELSLTAEKVVEAPAADVVAAENVEVTESVENN